MKYIILVFSVFLTYSVYGQEYSKISGEVINNDTKKAVEFASVSIQGTFIGVVTNEVGKFELKFPENLLNDTLVFSNIGYKTYRQPIKEYISKGYTSIKLQAEDYKIGEVFIMPEAKHPELIVKNAIKSIKENYPRNSYYLEIFFRETEYNHNKFLRLTEAAIGIQDFGFDSNVERSRIKLLELRKSNDYLEYGTSWKILNKLFGDRNILYETYYKDILRAYKTNELSPSGLKKPNSLDIKSMKYYDYSLQDIIYQDSSLIYVIDYKPKNIKTLNDKRPLIDIKGTLYIKKFDYAIVKLTANYFLNGKHFNGYDNGSNFIINYRKIKGKYYLNYLKQISSYHGTPSYTDENSVQISQYTKSSFYVTNIYTTKKEYARVRHREKQQKEIDLYKKEIPYNDTFWNRYNAVLRNPLIKKVQSDLEKEKKLDEQFKDNGKN